MHGMHPPWTWMAWAAAWLLPACALPAPAADAAGATPARAATAVAQAAPHNAGRCNAAPAQGAVGQVASAALAETARQQAGARTVRVIGHNDVVTKEYDTGRLNLQLDARAQVVRVYCG